MVDVIGSGFYYNMPECQQNSSSCFIPTDCTKANDIKVLSSLE